MTCRGFSPYGARHPRLPSRTVRDRRDIKGRALGWLNDAAPLPTRPLIAPAVRLPRPSRLCSPGVHLPRARRAALRDLWLSAFICVRLSPAKPRDLWFNSSNALKKMRGEACENSEPVLSIRLTPKIAFAKCTVYGTLSWWVRNPNHRQDRMHSLRRSKNTGSEFRRSSFARRRAGSPCEIG